jgi:hypothetical protein
MYGPTSSDAQQQDYISDNQRRMFFVFYSRMLMLKYICTNGRGGPVLPSCPAR